MKNYYQILQIDKNADLETIQRIYKYHIKKNHPDLYQGEEKKLAKEKVQLLNEAYEVLSDERKRKEYDESLEEQTRNMNMDNMIRLQQENEILREEIFQKEKEIQNISHEYHIPLDNQIGEKYDSSAKISINHLSDKNVMKRYLWYFGISFFKIVLMILIFALFLLILSSVTGVNYFNIIK